MPAPNLGPAYDAAVRIKALEDRLAKLEANPYGQAFSATQSDGTLGMSITQDTTNAGATAMVFYQGPNTPTDANTGQHPYLMYAGEVFVGGSPSDSAVVFLYPSGNQSMTVGAGGVGILDAAQNVVFTTDQTAGAGLGKPYIPMPLPQVNSFSAWPSTNATSWSLIAYSDPIMQHPKVLWAAYLQADAGTTGQVRLNINNGGAISPVHTISSTSATPVSDLIALPAGFYGQTWQVGVEAQVTAGTGSVRCQVVTLYGFKS